MRREEQRRQALLEQNRRQEEAEARRAMMLTVEDTQGDLQSLRGEMNRFRAEQNTAREQETRALEQRISRLESQLRELERARERDREEIIDSLTRRMAEIMREARPAPTSGGRVHTVSRGETLSAIAAAWGVTPQAIIRANNLPNPDVLREGQRLNIP